MAGVGTTVYAVLMFLCGGGFPGARLHGVVIDRPRYTATPRATASLGTGRSSAISLMEPKEPDGYNHRLMITVRDTAGNPLPHGSVLVVLEQTADTLRAEYDPDRRIYYADPDGFVTIRVSHPGYEPQQQRVSANSALTTVTFILGKPGDSYAYIASAMLPYEPRPDIIGFYLPRRDDSDAITDDELKRRLAATIPIARESIEFLGGGEGGGVVYGVFHLDTGGSAESIARMRSSLLRDLRGNPMIAQAGPVYAIERHSVLTWKIMLGFLSNRLYVRFMPKIRNDEARATLEGIGLRIIRFIGVMESFEVAADPSIGDDINDVARRLRALKSVYLADVVPCELIPKDW